MDNESIHKSKKFKIEKHVDNHASYISGLPHVGTVVVYSNADQEVCEPILALQEFLWTKEMNLGGST